MSAAARAIGGGIAVPMFHSEVKKSREIILNTYILFQLLTNETALSLSFFVFLCLYLFVIKSFVYLIGQLEQISGHSNCRKTAFVQSFNRARS